MPAAVEWRYPTAHNKMLQPSAWSNLEEAAKWLAGRTGKPWGARDVLNAAICYPIGDNPGGASNRCTAIGVALPQGHQIKRTVYDGGEGRAYLERLEKMGLLQKAQEYEPVVLDPLDPISRWREVALLQADVHQLLAAGWVEVATARKWTRTLPDDTWRSDVIDPPFIARFENAGICRRQLMELAGRWKDDNPAGPVVAEQGAPASDTNEPPQEWRNGLKRMAYEEAEKLIRVHRVLRGPALWAAMKARDDVKEAGRDSDQIEPKAIQIGWTRGEARIGKTQVQNGWRKELAKLLL